MSSCATVPTETQFQVFTSTSNSVSTSFSNSVTTLPPTTSTSTTTLCLDTTSNASCAATSVSVIFITSPGSTSTISVPVPVTETVVFTSSAPTRTLFSTSCSPTSAPPSPTSIASDTSATPPTSSPTFTPSFSDTILSSATLSNGTVVTTEVILTTTGSASIVTPPPTPSFNQGNGGGGGRSPSKTASIVGGAVGGAVGLLALLAGIWYVWRRSKRWDDIFDREEDEKQERRPRMSLGDEDVQPRPYHYGLVGHSVTPSPPSSPPLNAVERGHSPSNSLSLLNAPPNHSRSSSGVALSSPASMSRSMSDLASAPSPTARSAHVRPNLSTASSAASTRPLLERPVNHTRPPSSWSAGGQDSGPGTEVLIPMSVQSAAPGPRPHSAGGTLQTAPGPTASTEPMPRPQTSPANEKRRLLAALPQGAAAPTPPSSSVAGTAPPINFPLAESRAPRVSPRNPNRPSSSKGSNAVVVHTDAGPAAGPDQRSPPGSNEPPAYSPT